VPTYKTWVKGAHLLVGDGRTRRYTGLIPKISPLAVLTIALAQLRIDRMAKHLPLDAPWTAKRAAEWDARSVGSWVERSGIRSKIGKDLFEMAVRGCMTGDPSGSSKVQMRPPTRSRASRTATDWPAWLNRSAAVSPAYPAPTTHTSASMRSGMRCGRYYRAMSRLVVAAALSASSTVTTKTRPSRSWRRRPGPARTTHAARRKSRTEPR
jgi:hypothetical protein